MLALLRRLIIAACWALLALHPAAALDQVSMQLKWKHQFQFAGYYAALEQGFYRAAGLEVTIREGGPGIDVAETVASSKLAAFMKEEPELPASLRAQIDRLRELEEQSPSIIPSAERWDKLRR